MAKKSPEINRKKEIKKTSARTQQVDELTVDTPAQTSFEAKSDKGWAVGRFFWGGLLVVVGTLLLLNNLNVVETDLSALWQLWPLFIVATGLSILSVKSTLWKIISILFVIIALVFVMLVSLGKFDVTDNSVQSDSVKIAHNSEASRVETHIKMGAGILNVKSADQPEVVKAELASSFAELFESQQQTGDTQKITLETKGSGAWWFGAQKNELKVMLNKNVPLALSLDVGATNVNADISEVELTSLNVKTGASNVSLRLGERADTLPVSVDAGASSVSLSVPRESGIRVSIESGLSGRNLEGLNQVSDGVFETENYNLASNKIIITVKTGLSNFELTRY